MPTQIRPNLYIGSHRSIADIPALHTAGITAVLNCADNVEHSAELASQFKCFRFGLKDSGEHNPKWMIEAAVKTLQAITNGGENVLVHCYEGVHRSVTISALYLAKAEYITFAAAWQAIKKLRPQVADCKVLPAPFNIIQPLPFSRAWEI